MIGDWRKGDCAGCRQRMYINTGTGLCLKCENAQLKQDVSALRAQLEQANTEKAFYQYELTEFMKALRK